MPLTSPTPHLLALDPGTAKCGVCLFDQSGHVLLRRVIPLSDLSSLLQSLPGLPLAIGDGTTTLTLPTDRPQLKVDETGSTAEGRALWRKSHLLLALIEVFGYAPDSDGYAAEVIGRRAIALGFPA